MQSLTNTYGRNCFAKKKSKKHNVYQPQLKLEKHKNDGFDKIFNEISNNNTHYIIAGPIKQIFILNIICFIV